MRPGLRVLQVHSRPQHGGKHGSTGNNGRSSHPPRARGFAPLLAAGTTNREMAAALVVTERTARAHVESVLKKLGVGRHVAAALGYAWHTHYCTDVDHERLAEVPVPIVQTAN
ncbi:MAG: LuxR C-terminal-related transcriptional regulator [Jiangellaceae bacterium]